MSSSWDVPVQGGLAVGDLVCGLCCPLPVKLQTPFCTPGEFEKCSGSDAIILSLPSGKMNLPPCHHITYKTSLKADKEVGG